MSWQRNLYALTLASFFMFMAFGFVFPFLPLFISELAFPRSQLLVEEAKIGILLGSLISAVLGFVVLRLVTQPRDPAESASA